MCFKILNQIQGTDTRSIIPGFNIEKCQVKSTGRYLLNFFCRLRVRVVTCRQSCGAFRSAGQEMIVCWKLTHILTYLLAFLTQSNTYDYKSNSYDDHEKIQMCIIVWNRSRFCSHLFMVYVSWFTSFSIFLTRFNFLMTLLMQHFDRNQRIF